MVKKFNLFSYNIFLSTLFLINISNTISTLSLTYPTAVTLPNGNIFVVHSTGISICDSTYSTIIETILTFSSAYQLRSPNDLSKVSISQFRDGYIVCAIIDTVVLFDKDGRMVYTGSALYDNINIFVSADEILGDQYYYLIGFIYDGLIYLKYYVYSASFSSSPNSLHSSSNLREKNY